MAVAPGSLPMFARCASASAARTRWSACATGERRARASATTADGGAVIDMPMDVLLGKPPKMHRDVRRQRVELPPLDLDGVALAQVAFDVLRHPDRRQQALPDHDRRPHRRRPEQPRPDGRAVAGAGRRLRRDAGRLRGLPRRGDGDRRAHAAGRARCAGRRPDGGRRGDHQPARGADRARPRQAELQLDGGLRRRPAAPGDDAALYDTVRAVGMELCPALGISVPVGKDSLSMRTRWKGEGGAAEAGHRAGEPDRHRLRHARRRARHVDAAAPAGRHDAAAGRPRPGPDAHGRLDAGAGARPVRRRRCPTSTTRRC